MSDVVSYIVEISIKSGQLDNFKALAEEMVQSTHNEPNTLTYEWFLSDDNKTCHNYERYADSTTLMTHLATFGEKFAERFTNAADITRFTVYGAPNDELKGLLGGFGAVFMDQMNGFAR